MINQFTESGPVFAGDKANSVIIFWRLFISCLVPKTTSLNPIVLTPSKWGLELAGYAYIRIMNT